MLKLEFADKLGVPLAFTMHRFSAMTVTGCMRKPAPQLPKWISRAASPHFCKRQS
jgi:hypothetical protein